MDILIRQAHIVDPSSPFHQQVQDLFIQNGFIIEIGKINRPYDQVVSGQGIFISPGWVDVFADFCDPGYEYKETLESGAITAALGGYTDVMVIPNTNPAIQTKSSVEYIVQKAKSLPVSVYPIAAVSKNCEGKELAEMYDMYQSGAVAFSDGIHPVQSAGLLLKALQYIKAVPLTIIQLPDDHSVSRPGLMNEGIISTRLGLQGMPAIAEELMIERDIKLAGYCDSRIHFTGISTAVSTELIATAKSKGLKVTCSVTPYHLWFSHEDMEGYDTNLKVNPPLRSTHDREALRKAVRDGTIDCIGTHHRPQNLDQKMVEFEYASFGMIGLETSFAAVNSCVGELSIDRVIDLFSVNPRKIFGLPGREINIGKTASLTLFDPEKKWKSENSGSKSKNSAFFGKEFKGKPLGIINKDQLILNE